MTDPAVEELPFIVVDLLEADRLAAEAIG